MEGAGLHNPCEGGPTGTQRPSPPKGPTARTAVLGTQPLKQASSGDTVFPYCSIPAGFVLLKQESSLPFDLYTVRSQRVCRVALCEQLGAAPDTK